jgi:threonine aldolase
VINLFSDTQTLPSEGMRAAIASANVGDEQRFEDPTTLALEERVAELLGHEAAVFLPSGTMCNLIAWRLHVRPGGDEVLIGSDAHPLKYESGSPGAIIGAIVTLLPGSHGMFDGDAVRAAVRDPADRYAPRTRLVSVEQPVVVGGGRVWLLERIQDVLAAAAEHDLRTHLDGARLLNATAATGVSAADFARGFDTAWLDFTKGLGAPIGACLAGSRELIDEAWRYKQMLGGAMRQSGIAAAGAWYALDYNVERIAEDHENARILAEGLAELPGVEIDLDAVETNIVVFSVPDAEALVAALQQRGVLVGTLDETLVRAVTHLDVTRRDIDDALEAAAAAVANLV